MTIKLLMNDLWKEEISKFSRNCSNSKIAGIALRNYNALSEVGKRIAHLTVSQLRKIVAL